jgi:hypothetical protein
MESAVLAPVTVPTSMTALNISTWRNRISAPYMLFIDIHRPFPPLPRRQGWSRPNLFFL